MIISATFAQNNHHDNKTGPAASLESGEETSPAEHRLLKTLLDTGYDKRQRPVKVANQTIRVNISLAVFNLVDLVNKQIFAENKHCYKSTLCV